MGLVAGGVLYYLLARTSVQEQVAEPGTAAAGVA
jgi:hypothetical protein